MKALSFVLIACCIPAMGQDRHTPAALQPRNKTILLNPDPNSWLSEQDLRRLFSKTCPTYKVTSHAQKYDYVLETSAKTSEIHSTAVYDSGGMLIRSIESRPSVAIKAICYALDSAILVEVVDTQNLTQSSDLRNAPAQPGIAGIVDAIHGRRNTLTDNDSLDIIANGEHALLDCYEHHRGCTTIGPGKYYAEIDGDSVWIDYEMPITHQPIRNHYVIAGSW